MAADKKFHFTVKNYTVFGIGLAVLAAGYYMMSIGPYDSFWSMTLAPVLVVFSLAVVFPYGILKNYKKTSSENEQKKLDKGSK
jgi:hypothetical protein